MKQLAILGSTGSIGKQTLDVIDKFPDDFTVTYLTTNNNVTLLIEQVKKFKPKAVAVLDPKAYQKAKSIANGYD